MAVLLGLTRLVLGCVFAVAGIAKLMDGPGVEKGMKDFGLSAGAASAARWIVPLAELAVAFLLFVPRSGTLGGWAAFALLSLFTGAIVLNLVKGRTPSCRCFGQLDETPIVKSTVARNAVFLALALVTIAGGAGPNNLNVAESLSLITRDVSGVALLAGVAAAGVVAQTWLIVHLFGQQGRLLLRLDTLESAMAESGLVSAAGAESVSTGLVTDFPAPRFDARALGKRSTISMDQLLEPGKALLMLFTDPGCTPCTALLPDVARWEREYANKLTVAVISRGDEKANAEKVSRHGLRNVIIQGDWEIATSYGVTGTPSAVVVRADGTIGSSLATGVKSIDALVTAAVAGTLPARSSKPVGGDRPANARPHRAPAERGSPTFALPDIDGRMVQSSALEGQASALLFWNPACGYCERMLNDLRAFADDAGADAPRLVLISTGSPDANRAMRLKAQILLDSRFSVGSTLGVSGTPSAVLVGPDGRFASGIVTGAEGVLSLIGAERPARSSRSVATV